MASGPQSELVRSLCHRSRAIYISLHMCTTMTSIYMHCTRHDCFLRHTFLTSYQHMQSVSIITKWSVARHKPLNASERVSFLPEKDVHCKTHATQPDQLQCNWTSKIIHSAVSALHTHPSSTALLYPPMNGALVAYSCH